MRNQTGRSIFNVSGKPSFGPVRPMRRITRLAASIRTKASKLTFEERKELQESFLKRISPA